MEDRLYIYLAGTIRKGKEEENELMWTSNEMALLQEHVDRKIVFLNPAHRSDDLSDQKSVFGRDLFQVSSSDAILVDARGKRGLGVGAEMMYAHMHRIPVISWLPRETHYFREKLQLLGQEVQGYIHPFVLNLSDYIAHSLEEAAKWINQILVSPGFVAKGPETIKECMQHYLTTQLLKDHGMREIVSLHPDRFLIPDCSSV